MSGKHAALSCREAVRCLHAYLDGETTDALAARMEEHLEDCRRCGLELHVYLTIKRNLLQHRQVDDAAVQRLESFARKLTASS